MAKEDKKAIVKEIKDKFSNAKSVVVTDYRGLSVKDISDLRNKLRVGGSDYKVYKNTLVKIAVKSSGLEDLNPYLEGPTAIAFSYEDEISASKIINDFAKDFKELEVKAGALEEKVITKEQVKALADMPSKEQLLSMLLSAMQGPVRDFLGVLNAPIRDFTSVVRQVAEKAS